MNGRETTDLVTWTLGRILLAPLALLRLIVDGMGGGRPLVTPRRAIAPVMPGADIVGLLRLFRSTLGRDAAHELVGLLQSISANRDRLQRAVIVWLDLIETLVQSAEAHHGPGSGLGRLKKAEVSAAVKWLLNARQFSLSNVPKSLQPLIIDGLVDVAIDHIVQLTNDYDLWELQPPPRPNAMQRLLSLFGRVARAVAAWLVRIAAAPIGWFVTLFRRVPTIPPYLLAALRRVQQDGLVVREGEVVTDATRLLIYLGTHRDELVRASGVVFGAVQQGEALVNASGPEKKAYVRASIRAALTEMGFILDGGLFSALVDAAIDLLIEAAVHFFNKHGAFSTLRATRPRP
jgi:hypothetical protein